MERAEKLAYMREYNKILHMRVYRPDGKMPRALCDKVRLRCHEMGLDNAVANHVTQAICSLWEETEEFSIEWQWLHPEEAVLVANVMSRNWKTRSEESRQKLLNQSR